VPGGRGLRHIEYGNEVANAQFSTSKQIQNPQPSPVGKRPKNRFYLRLKGSSFHIRLCEYTLWAESGQGQAKDECGGAIITLPCL
jgi:hypothetical protein